MSASTDESKILHVLSTMREMTMSAIISIAGKRKLLPDNDGVFDVVQRLCRDGYANKRVAKNTYVMTTKGLRLLRMSNYGRATPLGA
jgi:hypothetical protein